MEEQATIEGVRISPRKDTTIRERETNAEVVVEVNISMLAEVLGSLAPSNDVNNLVEVFINDEPVSLKSSLTLRWKAEKEEEEDWE